MPIGTTLGQCTESRLLVLPALCILRGTFDSKCNLCLIRTLCCSAWLLFKECLHVNNWLFVVTSDGLHHRDTCKCQSWKLYVRTARCWGSHDYMPTDAFTFWEVCETDMKFQCLACAYPPLMMPSFAGVVHHINASRTGCHQGQKFALKVEVRHGKGQQTVRLAETAAGATHTY